MEGATSLRAVFVALEILGCAESWGWKSTFLVPAELPLKLANDWELATAESPCSLPSLGQGGDLLRRLCFGFNLLAFVSVGPIFGLEQKYCFCASQPTKIWFIG